MSTKHPPQFRIHSNGRLRSQAGAGGQGGLYFEWIAITRESELQPRSCGPMVYLREKNEWRAWDEPGGFPDLVVSLEIAIPSDLDVEIRRLTLTNHGALVREIEITTYAEISLNHPLGDAGHPAFSKLFVQTAATGSDILTARRRPRGANEHWPWVAQALVADASDISYETNRATFLGRGRSPEDPAAMDRAGALGGGIGNVLDTVLAWRCTVKIPAGEEVSVSLLTAVSREESAALEAIATCREGGAISRLMQAAGTAEATTLAELGIDADAAARYQRIAGEMLSIRERHAVPSSLAGSEVVNRYPLSWEELRIVATGGWDSAATRDLLAALPYWRKLGLHPRLFVMNGGEHEVPEGVTLTDSDDFNTEELTWWLASAQKVVGVEIADAEPEKPVHERIRIDTKRNVSVAGALDKLALTNGWGGFDAHGKEYLIHLPLENGRLRRPPMPWANVIANPSFGCLVTEAGSMCTWSRNSQANRLTPWFNDPIRDLSGEALYVIDRESGETWSPLPGPCPPRADFKVHHGFGRSCFHSTANGVSQTVQVMVANDAPVKLVSVVLENRSHVPRKLSCAAYHAVVMASNPDRHHAVLAWSDSDGTQHAVNPRGGDFHGGHAFAFTALHGASVIDCDSNNSTAAFFGDGGIADPDALKKGAWVHRKGFGRDACFCRILSFDLPPEGKVEVVIGIGEAMSDAQVDAIVARFRHAGAVEKLKHETHDHWNDLTGGIKIHTPLPEVDVMVNGWLLYQNLSCRIWGRTAFYQSGGAFGFRDQLQDSGALAALHPELMRSQILLHAAQQFPEGDVTHWWHPEPMGRGMRTKFADDLLWLPYLTGHFLEVTGDASVLDEQRPFIEGPQLKPGEDEEYMKPAVSERMASVFEHACLAIDKSLAVGAHGLPLMGIGDWNDGMSRIGREGKGESVWMAFFLIEILKDWAPLCAKRGDESRARAYAAHRERLLKAVNDTGWDGEWYRRAYYDDGTPLGTKDGDECRIDALAQAWAVISEAAPPDRAKSSLDALERDLADDKHDIIKLLDPPFVNTPHDPGYIKGYVAGVRENGGQYTHAACWVIRALAEAGRRDEAAKWLRKLTPAWHARDAKQVAIYQVEPYVVAADIYSVAPHEGRGGWTWYTGSAGWLFRVAVESVLGLRVENGDTVVLDPRIPDKWPGYSIDFKPFGGDTLHRIQVTVQNGKAGRVTSVTVDGVELGGMDVSSIQRGDETSPPIKARWPIGGAGKTYDIRVTLG